MLIAGIIALVLGGIFLFVGSRQKKTGSAMQASKVIPIKEVTEGMQAEIEGTIACTSPLQTPYSHRDCIAYEYAIEREDRVADAQGAQTSRWQQIASDKKSISFMVKDQSGEITVNPERASLDLQDFGEQIVRPGDETDNPIFKTVLNVMVNARTRVREKALVVGSHAYVFGHAAKSSQGLQIEKGNGDFVISYKTEAQIERSKARSAMAMTVIGIIAAIAGVALIVYGLM